MSPLDLLPGALFAEDFQIVRRLGVGDNGAVYVVEHITTGAERALKVVAPHVAPDEDARLAFEREARVGSQIESDHVVLVVGAGLDPKTKMAWVAMELLDGVDLATRFAEGAPMPLAEVALLFAQLCEALGAAHEVGITHGDVKPTNVFLAKARNPDAAFDVKVLDFGVAKLTITAESAAAGMQGTPLWMAPEQATPGGVLSPATDVWAVGLLAFWALTGKSYWLSARANEIDLASLTAEVRSAARASATERAQELGVTTRLPEGFDAWLARCLHHDAEGRYATASQASVALATILGQASQPPAPQVAVALPPKPPEWLVRTQNRPMSDHDWFKANVPPPVFSGGAAIAAPAPVATVGAETPAAAVARVALAQAAPVVQAAPFAPGASIPIAPMPDFSIAPAEARRAAPAPTGSGSWRVLAVVIVAVFAIAAVAMAWIRRAPTAPTTTNVAPLASASIAPTASAPWLFRRSIRESPSPRRARRQRPRSRR